MTARVKGKQDPGLGTKNFFFTHCTYLNNELNNIRISHSFVEKIKSGRWAISDDFKCHF